MINQQGLGGGGGLLKMGCTAERIKCARIRSLGGKKILRRDSLSWNHIVQSIQSTEKSKAICFVVEILQYSWHI